jgi:hypothetical protein
MPFIQNIQLPTLILQAQDDPFMDHRVIPVASQLSANTAYEISPHGGHVGFMYGKPTAPKLWLPERIFAFFQDFL